MRGNTIPGECYALGPYYHPKHDTCSDFDFSGDKFFKHNGFAFAYELFNQSVVKN